MKKLYILAALLMATTSAHAGGITIQINGERVRVEAPRNCTGISCIKITSPGYTGTLGNIDLKGMGSKSKDDDDVVATAPAAPARTRSGPSHCAAAPAATAVTPAPAPAQTTVAARTEVAPPAPPPPPAPVAAVPAPAPQPAPVAAAVASDPNSPIGVWATEENKGNVRIEECGANLCGYAVNTGAKNPDQHEAAGQQVDRPHP